MWPKAGAMLALLFSAAFLLAACGPDAAPPTAIPTPTPEVVVIVVTPEPTPNLEATVAAMVATALPDPTPTVTPDIPGTVSAELTKIAPSPTPTSDLPTLSTSDIVKGIEDGLVQIIGPTGSGSGFVVSSDGLIVTNAHVVGRNAWVSVYFVDGQIYGGQVLGRNESIDLAVVKVDSQQQFQPMALGNSADIEAGDEVIALGFPLSDELGLDYTVTTGVVSSIRTTGSVEQIQTDAAINPGNSGGPLVDRQGRVIGVNTGAYTDYAGIALAVSVDEVSKHLDYLVAGRNTPANLSEEWWTYENDDCRYSLRGHPNWVLSGESDFCDVTLQRYDDTAFVEVVMYEADPGETLREFANFYRDSVQEFFGNWAMFELISFERKSNSYQMTYQWSYIFEPCTNKNISTMVKSNSLNHFLVIGVNYCSPLSDATRDEMNAILKGIRYR